MASRHKSRRLVVFNHKGGVGKTTLTINIALKLAEQGFKILLVDSDPQCNLTSHLVADDVVDDLLDSSDLQNGQTIWSALKPVAEAEGDIAEIRPIELRSDQVFLLPGDIRLSEFEVELPDFWSQSSLRKAKGFRGITALSRLVNHISTNLDVDFVFYDSGPNIGLLNRIVVLDCDYFIVPAACDLFSLRALKTLGNSLSVWIREWENIVNLAPEDWYMLPGRPQFLGYIPEGFKTYRGVPAQQHSRFLSRIAREIHSQIVVLLRNIDESLARGSMGEFRLGEVKDYATLVAASQESGLPISEVTAGTPSQRQHAAETFTEICRNVVARIEALESDDD